MPPATPKFDFTHEPGFEILTKNKNTIRELYSFAKILVEVLITRYKLGRSIISKILISLVPKIRVFKI
jgi:hypothetical protein